MKLNILVISKHKWSSRLSKHKAIKKTLMLGGFTDVIITTVHKDVGVPEIKKGQITEKWFEEHITKLAKQGDYNFVIFHFTETEGKKWGVDSGIRGANFRDNDFFGESWVCSNEKSIVKFQDGSERDRYTKVIPHEIGHELKNQDITQLDIHNYDYKDEINKLEQFYIDFGSHRTLLEKLQNLKDQLLKLYVRPFKEWDLVTQPYGNLDCKTYPKTCRHIGTDFKTPLGTLIKAPVACAVTRSGYSDTLGFWCEVAINDWYMVCLHLKEAPAIRRYAQGETIGSIGATGAIQGVHAHIEGWNQPMDRSLLTKTNWNQLTFDIKNKIK